VKTRPRPKHLAEKLLAIRQRLGIGQYKFAKLLNSNINCSRVSEYERGVRVPSLLVLLRYSQIARVHMETLVDDRIDGDQFQFDLEQ
jgi:transcriptional regulator with XRE-family HTH domain